MHPHWGYKENGSWYGVFGMLQKYEVDLFAGDVLMTLERLEIANYLTPFVLST